jgi:hypothetical protein
MIPSSYVHATAASESALSTLICDKKGCDRGEDLRNEAVGQFDGGSQSLIS